MSNTMNIEWSNNWGAFKSQLTEILTPIAAGVETLKNKVDIIEYQTAKLIPIVKNSCSIKLASVDFKMPQIYVPDFSGQIISVDGGTFRPEKYSLLVIKVDVDSCPFYIADSAARTCQKFVASSSVLLQRDGEYSCWYAMNTTYNYGCKTAVFPNLYAGDNSYLTKNVKFEIWGVDPDITQLSTTGLEV